MTTFPFLEAAYIAKKMSGGSNDMPETLKIIDEAPAIATVPFSDNGWKIVFKKVDGLHQDSYTYSRYPRSTADATDWRLGKLVNSNALLALCVYFSNTLKWVAEVQYEWKLQSNNYKWGLTPAGERFWKYQQIKWGVATGNDDEIQFADNVFRLTELKPLLPSSTSAYASVGLQATYLYDEQVINYDYDGTVLNINYNRNLTKTTGYWYTNVVKNEYLPDPENFEKDFINFCDAVMAYVSK